MSCPACSWSEGFPTPLLLPGSLFSGNQRGLWLPGEAAGGSGCRPRGWDLLPALPPLPARRSPGFPPLWLFPRRRRRARAGWAWMSQHRHYVCSWDPRGLRLSHSLHCPPQSLCTATALREGAPERGEEGSSRGPLSGWRGTGLEERGAPPSCRPSPSFLNISAPLPLEAQVLRELASFLEICQLSDGSACIQARMSSTFGGEG